MGRTVEIGAKEVEIKRYETDDLETETLGTGGINQDQDLQTQRTKNIDHDRDP